MNFLNNVIYYLTFKSIPTIDLFLGIDTKNITLDCIKIICKSQIEKNINFQDYLLLPIKMNQKFTKSIDKFDFENTKLENLINLNEIYEEKYKTHLKTVSKPFKDILKSCQGRWKDVYGYYYKCEEYFDNLYYFTIGKKKYIFNNKTGIFKHINSNEIYFPGSNTDNKIINKNQERLYKDIAKILHVNICSKEIIEQDGKYYLNEGEKSVELTNWTGKIVGNIKTDTGDVLWKLKIGIDLISLTGAEICTARYFQLKIASKGRFFFYGNDNQLKKLIEHIS